MLACGHDHYGVIALPPGIPVETNGTWVLTDGLLYFDEGFRIAGSAEWGKKLEALKPTKKSQRMPYKTRHP
ncbi:MAG: hypothetical protein C0404_09610 [Verrucomicrobia bacterium]|nr:hypothetical protein [Verrucomicrobiota bacterium]